MFNPFVPFHSKMIEGFRSLKHRYLVTQTFRGRVDHYQDEGRTVLLLTDYEEENRAKVHWNAVRDDPYKYILDLENEAHRNKLIEMLQPGSRYRLLAAFIEDVKAVEKRLNAKYANNIRNYIQRETNWRIGAGETIFPKLDLAFGELFVTLKYSNQTVRLRLSDLEKY